MDTVDLFPTPCTCSKPVLVTTRNLGTASAMVTWCKRCHCVAAQQQQTGTLRAIWSWLWEDPIDKRLKDVSR